MNAVISLCHFCEHHGPSILFCTQAFHSQDPHHVLEDSTSSAEQSKSSYYVRSERVMSPSVLNENASIDRKTDLCEACRSLERGQPGFISNDHQYKVSYVSSQHPDHPQVYSMVRQACVRSLSCEVCPGREGPFFFGDDSQGHVFSYTFYVKDAQARGFSRWYSILVVMMDKIYLVNSWPFLVKHIQKIIKSIQDKCEKVYTEEQTKCPQRALRLCSSMNPASFRFQRGNNKYARSLKDFTGDQNVFASLHVQFTWILKACSHRLTEKLLEGPPTEDAVFDLEKKDETSASLKDEKSLNEFLSTSFEFHEEKQPYFRSLRHILETLGLEKFHIIAYNTIVGNQIILRGNNENLVKSFFNGLKSLLPKGCCKTVYYTSVYEDSWKCNFLGVTPNTEIPKHIIGSELYLFIDFSLPVQSKNPYVSEVEFIIQSCEIPKRGPIILEKMEATLLNRKLSDGVVEQCLICLKEEWMNKVKVLFMFTKAGSNHPEEERKKLFQVLGEEDKCILKFWMTGLSDQYKNHMLAASACQAVGN